MVSGDQRRPLLQQRVGEAAVEPVAVANDNAGPVLLPGLCAAWLMYRCRLAERPPPPDFDPVAHAFGAGWLARELAAEIAVAADATAAQPAP